jgi:DNA invertase Pin-like site-specific DNA recombinase
LPGSMHGMSDYGFIRVSTGSQDAQTQERDILQASPAAVIVRTDTKAASASKGEQLDAMDSLIGKLHDGDRVIVTDSSRLDRDPDQWAQMARLVSIKAKGAEVVDLSNPGFGSDDRFGVVMTALHQMENADKSRTVKTQTRRGMSQVRANGAHHGPLPMFWTTEGEKYAKQAVCTDPAKVRDVYARVADGESLQSVANVYECWPASIKALIRFDANHTGVIACKFTDLEWVHKVDAPVESALWWRANKVLDANTTKDRANRGGRPVAQTANWLSGVLSCPECGGRLFVNAGKTPAGNPRTPMLRCGGMMKTRRACGRYKGVDVRMVTAELDSMFACDDTEILAFQRVTGNAHELDELQADLARLQARLSATTDDDELDALVADRKALKARIAGFMLVPDVFDYAPTGQTVGSMWNGSEDGKRRIVKAVAATLGLDITPVWGMDEHNFYTDYAFRREDIVDGIVDLGEGVCFRAS